MFDITTRDEIVVDTNAGGRSTFKNAGHTSRRGIELSHVGYLSDTLRTTVSLSAMRARFDDAFVSGTGSVPNVFSGNHLPGTPERNLFAELVWSPANAWAGFSGGAEVVHTAKLYVNDTNTDNAPSSTVFNLRASFRQKFGGWEFSELIRVDNATDRYYAGSVIVNDGNRLGLYLGGGIHVFLNDFIALDFTVRDYAFSDNPSGADFNADLAVTKDDSRFLHHLFFGAGVSIMFPTTVKRTR